MKLRKIMAAVLICFAGLANAQMQMPTIPLDPDVRIGKLDNGLTYYIRHNNWPEKRANFYIAQKVGSIQEEESQRGLAHFLEHMCFNGTKNFEGNEVMRYCESIGVQFGRDLNAYTSIDQTVYNISNVPTDPPVGTRLMPAHTARLGKRADARPEGDRQGARSDTRRVAHAVKRIGTYVRA